MLPVMLDIRDKLCVIIGGGNVGYRKAITYLENHGRVRVVSEHFMHGFFRLSVERIQKRYNYTDLEGAFFVTAATDDRMLNQKIIEDAKKLGILALSVTGSSDLSGCAYVRKGDVTIAASTDKTVPAMSGRICAELEPNAEEYAKRCSLIQEYRRRAKKEFVHRGEYRERIRKLSVVKNLTREQAESIFGEQKKERKEEKAVRAILVVSFGTSDPDALHCNIETIEHDIQHAYPDREVRRAFTSNMIIQKLKKRDGVEIDTPQKALERLYQDGFQEVTCVVTHIMNGFEYEKVQKSVEEYKRKMSILITRPLLSEPKDYQELIQALSGEICSDKLYIFMGHGTEHYANAAYPALDYCFKAKGFHNVFIGTVEGYPGIADVYQQIKDNKNKKIVLRPLMLVAGEHAKNDMAGEKNSWKFFLQKHGFEVECIVRGLGTSELIRRLYLKRIIEVEDFFYVDN